MFKKLIKNIFILFSRENNNYNKKFITSYHIHPTAILYKKENIAISESALICEYVIVRAPIGKLVIGDNSQIGPFNVIFTFENVFIGNNVMIAPHCVIASGKHNYLNIQIPMIEAENISDGPIIISDDVWIGANCTILDNIKIGKGAVIAANSLVNTNVGDYEIYGGVPAKFLKNRK